MGYAVLHLDKASANEAKMTAHIERTQMPKNADPERTHLNRELIEFPEGVGDRTQAIQHRIDNAGLIRKIGTNQVRAIRIVLTGSNKDMKRIEQEGRLDEWCEYNLEWIRKTYGADNLVSAVLHLDEATPHLHATIIPIVTGERRKVKENRDKLGKKKYRKKDPNASRLCADDVMTRIKLKEYQDTYAQAMSKYGLERGIVGSDARHISTQEFYSKVMAQKENLQEDIELLIQAAEAKRQNIDDLEQKEQEAQARTQQAEAKERQAVEEQEQAEGQLAQTKSELKEVKGQLKTEKFKGVVSDAGSAIMDGISSALNTSKVKRQQQEIDGLKTQNADLNAQLNNKEVQIKNLRQDHDKEIERLKGAYENQVDKLRQREQAAVAKHKQQIDGISKWFPYIPSLAEIAEYCKSAGFTDPMVFDLLKLNPVKISAALYSPEHKQHFDADGAMARIEKQPDNPNSFRLTINGINIIQWFRQKYDELRERLGFKPRQTPDQNRRTGPKL